MVAMLALAAAGAARADDDEELARRGEAAYRGHCVQCHGVNADGRGPLAERFKPPPANLRASVKTDDYKTKIITLGGKAMGRSEVMPAWGLELTKNEIAALVGYLRKVANESAASKAPRSAANGRPRG